MDRRDFLKALGAGLLTRSCFAQDLKAPRKVKSVIWLWMDGAPSSFETWDPKPGLGGAKDIPTSVDGIRISERLPLCAKQMHLLSVIRSVYHDGVNPEESDYLMHCGLRPSCWDVDVPMGSILAYELWKRDAGVPPFIVFDAPGIPESATMGDLFIPVYMKGPTPEFQRRTGPERWALLAAQDQGWAVERRQKAVLATIDMRGVSEQWMNSSLVDALDVSREPADLLRSYGSGFGRNCILARRLVQAGTAVVEVGLRGWRDGDSPELCTELDAGLSTLVRDLAEKNMLKDTVVFCASGSGRSPGKDRKPWTKGFSVVMAGGSLAGGRAYGDTGADGLSPVPKVPLWNLFATLLNACGVDSNKKYETMGRKNKYVSQGGSVSTSGRSITELF
jgi:hypothetical protein